ncbi:hypothetical protein F4678DRAFT_455284 [Xylaria arbuscula]|nr:hypothetical protein F4678DRAFT_455284 [Xylaria arbuscula]
MSAFGRRRGRRRQEEVCGKVRPVRFDGDSTDWITSMDDGMWVLRLVLQMAHTRAGAEQTQTQTKKDTDVGLAYKNEQTKRAIPHICSAGKFRQMRFEDILESLSPCHVLPRPCAGDGSPQWIPDMGHVWAGDVVSHVFFSQSYYRPDHSGATCHRLITAQGEMTAHLITIPDEGLSPWVDCAQLAKRRSRRDIADLEGVM